MKEHLIGIDIGSVSIGAVHSNPAGIFIEGVCRPHQGRILQTLDEVLGELHVGQPVRVVATGSGAHMIRATRNYHWQVACVSAARAYARVPRGILMVGGEEFALLELDEHGRYRRARTNSECAAGTGSFLDQQAERLMLDGGQALAEAALQNSDSVPDIASRCSVFAKTDLIHAQQEGYGVSEICEGLCRGLARSLAGTLFSYRTPPVPLLFVGGVACNDAVHGNLERLLEIELDRPERPELFAAYGATLTYISELQGTTTPGTLEGGLESDRSVGRSWAPRQLLAAELSAGTEGGRGNAPRFTPPQVKLTEYPDFAAHTREEYQTSEGRAVEIDLYEAWSGAERGNAVNSAFRKAFIGIDIGSTSTKAVLLDDEREVLLGVYTRTAGRPVFAVQGLFEAIEHVTARDEKGLHFLGAATTGSGRKFVGAVIGADTVTDEISAHARAAYELEPAVDTIIEIGGQDSKFTTLRDGRVTFSQMNTVCAAGTGSFLEEQAARLGIPLEQFAERASSAEAPMVSDRCTVFMERDISACLAEGYGSDELLAAAAYAVTENYLQKVAVQSNIGQRICFQGATAKNAALVGAFEQKLGVDVSVSRYAHLAGAVGAALIAADETSIQPAELSTRTSASLESAITESKFRGLGICQESIPTRTEVCEICSNRCSIRIATVHGQQVAYGFLCGRDYQTRKYVDNNRSGFDPVKERKRIFRRARNVPRSGEAASGAATQSKAMDGSSAKGSLPRAATRGTEAESGTQLSEAVSARVPEGTEEPVEAQVTAQEEGSATSSRIRIGLPRGPGIYDELPLWRRFFALLGVPTVELPENEDPVSEGKQAANAEFCAPMQALHGDVSRLRETSDHLFLPVYLQDRAAKTSWDRQYCYYTQYSVPAVANSATGWEPSRLLSPVMKAKGGRRQMISELDRLLRPLLGLSRGEIAGAYRDARQWFLRQQRQLRNTYTTLGPPQRDEVRVVLLGRPYAVVNPALNKHIPDLFGTHGVKCVFQDMLPISETATQQIRGILDAVHWRYGSEVLAAAATAADTEGLYPVFVSAFKCSPDSFVVDYFKRIMEQAGKPYVVLQLDDHASNVGYETRIEAAVRAFRNHRRSEVEHDSEDTRYRVIKPRSWQLGIWGRRQASDPVNPEITRRLDGKTVLFPNWDPVSCRLVAANLRRGGYDVRPLDENEHTIRAAMRHNTGQCLPVNIIAEEFIRYIQEHDLDPANTVLWMARSGVSCNLRMFPYFIKSLLEQAGGGLERAGVYVGDITHFELSPKFTINAYFAYLAGGFVRRAGCRVRPYELEPGATDKAIEQAVDILEPAFAGEYSIEEGLNRVADLFSSVPVRDTGSRPKVAIVGDLYLRDNEVMNQNLFHAIEAAGGEVVTTPFNEYMKIISEAYFEKLKREGRYSGYLGYRALLGLIEAAERRFFGNRFSVKRAYSDPEQVERVLGRFGVRVEHSGETQENLLKLIHLVNEHPDLALIVHVGPSFCCPTLITEGLAERIQEVIGVPVVPITYDGTGTYQNDKIEPYLHLASS